MLTDNVHSLKQVTKYILYWNFCLHIIVFTGFILEIIICENFIFQIMRSRFYNYFLFNTDVFISMNSRQILNNFYQIFNFGILSNSITRGKKEKIKINRGNTRSGTSHQYLQQNWSYFFKAYFLPIFDTCCRSYFRHFVSAQVQKCFN